MNDLEFAKRYYEAWNARNLDQIIALYHEDIEFSSPYIAALGFAPDGVIHGRDMLKLYFQRALERAPDLTFTAEMIFVGARGHTLIYRNHRGERTAEHHEMDALGSLIVRAEATYEPS